MDTSSDTPPLFDDAGLIEAAEAEALPTSLGVFNPVGHVMVALRTQAQADALMATLYETGWPDTAVRQFAPDGSTVQFTAMVDQAGHLAGFGYEITLLRRYLVLATAGARWLLVKADDTDQAAVVARAARACDALLAVHYRALTAEELITEPAAR